jgi:hypothetical protein
VKFIPLEREREIQPQISRVKIPVKSVQKRLVILLPKVRPGLPKRGNHININRSTGVNGTLSLLSSKSEKNGSPEYHLYFSSI